MKLSIEQKSECIYVLDNEKIVHKLQKTLHSDSYVCERTFNYSNHDMTSLLTTNWSRCHISTPCLTFNEITYRVLNDDARWKQVPKSYFWYFRKSFENNNTPLRGDEAKLPLYENWQV